MRRMDQYIEGAGTGAEESRVAVGPTARDTVGVLRRRLPLIVAALILTPLIAVLVYVAFSVAVTEASSRNMFAPRRARTDIRYSCAETSESQTTAAAPRSIAFSPPLASRI